MGVHGDQLILAEHQRIQARVGVQVPQLCDRAPDSLGEIRGVGPVLADQREVPLTVGGTGQCRGDRRIDELIERRRRLDGAVVRFRLWPNASGPG